MIYAALGDSITYGYEASAENKQFVSHIQSVLARNNRRVSVFKQARPGWTSKQLLKSLPKVPTCIWDEAALVTILIGGNDLLKHTPWIINGDAARYIKVAETLRENLTKVIGVVKRPSSKILLSTVYNPFPNSIVASECTDMLNKSIRLVAANEQVILVDIHALFSKREQRCIEGYRRGEIRDFKIWGNPIHPNDKGHQLIAQAFLKAYRQASIKQNQGRRFVTTKGLSRS